MFDKIEDPYPLFFALIFKYILKEPYSLKYNNDSNIQVFLNFLKLDRSYSLGKIKNTVIYYLFNDSYVSNDLGITESDFSIFQDILLSVSPVMIKPNIFGGMFFDVNPSISFRFKGKDINSEEFNDYISIVTTELLDISTKINNKNLKENYLKELQFIISKQKNLKIKKG